MPTKYAAIKTGTLEAALRLLAYAMTDAEWTRDFLTDAEQELVSEQELADLRGLCLEHLGTDDVHDVLAQLSGSDEGELDDDDDDGDDGDHASESDAGPVPEQGDESDGVDGHDALQAWYDERDAASRGQEDDRE